MLHVETAVTIRAPQPRVVAIYRDVQRWPAMFPTIRGVRLVGEEAGHQVLDIDHREGPVRNVLTQRSPEEIELREWKRRCDATFLNRFEAVPEGTRYTLEGDITLKGIYRLLQPFVHGYIRRQMTTLVLDAVRKVAEEDEQMRRRA